MGFAPSVREGIILAAELTWRGRTFCSSLVVVAVDIVFVIGEDLELGSDVGFMSGMLRRSFELIVAATLEGVIHKKSSCGCIFEAGRD